MRQTIVEMLKNAGGRFISGENIADELCISRTAVWKHIQKLKKNGYEIVSQARLGYKLKDAPDLLLPSEIQSDLHTKIIASTSDKIIYHPSVNSTNFNAKALAYHGAKDGTVVVAEEQTGGKGRLDRKFFSPRGKGIFFSAILRPKFLPHNAPKVTLMAAVAVANAMKKFGMTAEIKWPNDIMYDGRKVVGILTEVSGEIGKINYLIVGIGVNVNISREEFPEELRNIASSLSEIKGENIPRVKFFRTLLEEFDKLYIEINENGFEKIFSDWRKFNITFGKKIRVISADTGDSFEGTAIDIDIDGALVVETSEGKKTVYAGDVSIRCSDDMSEKK